MKSRDSGEGLGCGIFCSFAAIKNDNYANRNNGSDCLQRGEQHLREGIGESASRRDVQYQVKSKL